MSKLPVISALILSFAILSAAPHARADADAFNAQEANADLVDEGAGNKKPNCEAIRNFTKCMNTKGCAPSTNESNRVTPWSCLSVE